MADKMLEYGVVMRHRPRRRARIIYDPNPCDSKQAKAKAEGVPKMVTRFKANPCDSKQAKAKAIWEALCRQSEKRGADREKLYTPSC